MTAKSSSETYGWVAQWLHWLIAALIVTQFVLGQLAATAADSGLPVRQLALLANHKSVGITVLVLAIVRLAWRWVSSVPRPPATMPGWQVWASRAAHSVLYGLIFALPISGWMMSSASAYTVSWFNLMELPDLVGADELLKERLVRVHHTLAATLFGVASLHVLAALKHQFIDRDGVLMRMLSVPGAGMFVIVLAGTIWATARPGGPVSATYANARSVAGPPAHADADISRDSSLAPWEIDYARSYIHFRAEQAGAGFDGDWPDWRAEIRFDPDALDASGARVEIDVASVSTGDRERDETLLAADWFAAAAHPTAVFRTEAITADGADTYVADGSLIIKSTATPVQLIFTAVAANDRAHWELDGSARLDRLAMQLGTGEWADPTWVGQFVDVSVHVEAAAQP